MLEMCVFCTINERVYLNITQHNKYHIDFSLILLMPFFTDFFLPKKLFKFESFLCELFSNFVKLIKCKKVTTSTKCLLNDTIRHDWQ